jgi:hypothetical protein
VESTDFLLKCLIAITFVFVVLSVLSLSIKLLITIFPERSQEDDAVVIAAITSHFNRVNPQRQITKIEEKK